MKVEVILYATLSVYHPQGEGIAKFTVELPEGSKVSDLLKYLDLKRNEAKQVFIRHKSRPDDFLLRDGDRVAVFPPVAGG